MPKKIIRTSTVPTSLASLLKGQLMRLNQDYDLLAVSSPGERLELVKEREGVKTIAVSMERQIAISKDLQSLIRLILLFAKEKPDMVHSITPKAGLLSMLAAKITRVPVRMHTFTGLIFPTSKGFKKQLLIAMDRLTCFCATHVNPEGEGVKRDLMNYKITSKPLKILANGNVNGIDLAFFERTAEVEASAKTYKDENFFTFCFVGRMVKDKGINELVNAFVQLQAKNKQVRLFLVGPFEKALDPVLPEVESLIHEHPNIRFFDFQADIRPFLAAADAFVFPSYREGFPNVVLQAGTMGLPSIVTDINGSNEIIIEGKNGIIIPSQNQQSLFDAMEWFYQHPNELKTMADNARHLIASRYEQQVVWDALLAEYKALLAE